MLKELLQPEIEDLIEEKEWDALTDILPLWQEVETANLITSLKNDDKYNIGQSNYYFCLHFSLFIMRCGRIFMQNGQDERRLLCL